MQPITNPLNTSYMQIHAFHQMNMIMVMRSIKTTSSVVITEEE